MSQPNKQSTPSQTRTTFAPLVAGFSGGAASTALLYPLDLVKTRLQVNENPSSNTWAGRKPTPTTGRQPPSMIYTLRGVTRHEGFLGLYQGLTPALLGNALSWGGYFFIYEAIKEKWSAYIIQNNQHHQQPILGSFEYFVASCTSGAIMVLLTNPVWLIKTRMQLQMKRANLNLIIEQQQQQGAKNGNILNNKAKAPYTGITDAIRTIVKEEGFWALYRGAVPALLLTSHGGVQFVAYEWLKGRFLLGERVFDEEEKGGNKGRMMRRSVWKRFQDSLGYLSMGAVSKIIASTTTYPLQVIKARLQQRSQAVEILSESGEVAVVKREYSGVVDCVTKIWKREGVAGFFKGCLPNVIRVAPGAAVTFVVYESVMDILR